MRFPTKIILRVVLPLAVILISTHVSAKEKSNGDQSPEAKQDVSVSAMDLAEIIPKAAKLSGSLSFLENRATGKLDVSELEKKYAMIEDNLKGPAVQVQQIKDSKKGRLYKFVNIRKVIERENLLFIEINKPLYDAIREYGELRIKWQGEKQIWNQWQSILLKDADLAELNSTFEKADNTIDKALAIINSQLNLLLPVQQRAGSIQAKIFMLEAELDSLILAARSGDRVNLSPPMFSFLYFSQFSSELWYELKKGLDQISWPDSLFFDQQGLIVFLQVFISLLVIIAAYRIRQVLSDSKRWFFLAARPISTGLWIGTMMFMVFYEYRGGQDTWGFVLSVIGGISFARLIGALYPASWKRQFVNGFIIIFITTRLLQTIILPLPLFRLYTVLTASVGLLFCWRWASESVRQKDSRVFTWTLWIGTFFLAFIIITDIWGKRELARFLFISLMRSATLLIGFMLFFYMIHGFIDWVFRSSSLKQSALFSGHIDDIVRRATIFIDAAIGGIILLPSILFIWGVYDDLPGAIKNLLALDFNLGSNRISVGLVIASAGILYGSVLLSRIAQKILMGEVLAKRRIEAGVRVSIARLVHYALIFIGFLVALLALGFEFTKLTIMLSALGVGIGFGLQGVVNNFVSGLILLFERPVRVGDYIEFDGKWAEIKKIGLRATIVQTFDQADVIIPNADLVANQVINWTLSNRRVRLIIPVGVAYGSDIALVMETLLACTKENSMVAEVPAAQVLYLNFGESSLEFELRLWVLDADNRLVVSSELHQEIDRRFREAKIEIAFPQQDLHLRSMDESIMLQSMKTSK